MRLSPDLVEEVLDVAETYATIEKARLSGLVDSRDSHPPFPIYVGYDIREHLAWLVCQSSLIRPVDCFRSPDRHLAIVPLSHRQLRREGLFDRAWRIGEDGQFSDERDGRPFSTEFSHSRFLVPALAAQASDRPVGERGWAMFVDCDFMFRQPVTDLLRGLDPTKAVYVVKHDFSRVVEGVKMDGMVQQRYYRKLWSSLVLWNLDHPKVTDMDWRRAANEAAGGDLHSFPWFTDDEIGGLDETWNWIPGHSVTAVDPAAVHWSLGGPWMQGYEQAAFSEEWSLRLADLLRQMAAEGDYARLQPLT